jgi:WD40 repeat protein
VRDISALGAGHSGPISQVCCDWHFDVALSASYDKTVRIWSFSGQEKACLKGHQAPILELATDHCGRLLSGDRSGHIKLWDLHAAECTWALKSVHKGHVTALAWADASGGYEAWKGCFASGGQDGYLRLWDPRAHSNPVKLGLHANGSGKGAVTGIIVGGAAASYMAATCGADGTVRVLDARVSVGEVASFDLPDFPYSFKAAGGLLLAGCGDGSLHVIDLATLQRLYALGANQHAVRTIDTSQNKLVCSGDDGKAIIYEFL